MAGTGPGPASQMDGGEGNRRPRAVFRRRHRLGHNREFQAVYAAKVRKARGPIAVFGIPNDLGHARLGLSVGRQVGIAVARNRIKRLLREAFRLEQAAPADGSGLPTGLDLVVTVRPHRTMTLSAYRRVLVELAREVEREWERRRRRERAEADEGAGA